MSKIIKISEVKVGMTAGNGALIVSRTWIEDGSAAFAIDSVAGGYTLGEMLDSSTGTGVYRIDEEA